MIKDVYLGESNFSTLWSGQSLFGELQNVLEGRKLSLDKAKNKEEEREKQKMFDWLGPHKQLCFGWEGPDLGWYWKLIDWIYCVFGQVEHLQEYKNNLNFF